MLADRPYMRSEYRSGGSLFPVTLWLLGINLGMFVLQNIDRVYTGTGFVRWLALSSTGLRHGYVWQLFTFQFLHFDLLHFLFNSLMIFFLGRVMESQLGRGRFLLLYLGGGTLGGLLQGVLGLLSASHFGSLTVGASAGVCALLAVYCLLHRDHTILLFFVLPVRAIYVLWGSLAIAGFFVLVPPGDGVAHAAHLGGLLAGMAFVKLQWHQDFRPLPWVEWWSALRSRTRGSSGRVIPVRRGAFRRANVQRAPEPRPEEAPAGEFISQEVDPILDKISQHGIQSLTDREKKILEAARAKMAKR